MTCSTACAPTSTRPRARSPCCSNREPIAGGDAAFLTSMALPPLLRTRRESAQFDDGVLCPDRSGIGTASLDITCIAVRANACADLRRIPDSIAASGRPAPEFAIVQVHDHA